MRSSSYYSAASGVGALAVLLWVGLIALVVLCIVAWCKIFRKAGIHPGKFFIPVYGQYLQYSIADSGGLFAATIVISVITGLVSTFTTANSYNYYSRGPSTATLVILGIAAVAELIIFIIFSIRLARVFGKSGGFAVGLILLFPIFICILGFGSAQYIYQTGYSGTIVQETWTCPQCGTINAAHSGACVQCQTLKPRM